MKTLVSVFVFTLIFIQAGLAQQNSFNYQTVVRNGSGQIITDQEVSFRMSIRENTAGGEVVYQENHNVSTNDHGLVNFRIGAGSSSDSFDDIVWGDQAHYLEVEIDENGGSNYQEMGTTQLVSVPYAMHAYSAEMVDDADADPTNELQNLSISGNNLSISNGNTIALPEAAGPDENAIAKAWVNFPITGTPNLNFDAYNVVSTSVTTVGVRVVTLPPGLFSTATNPACICQIRNDLAPGFCVVTSSSSPSAVTVRTYNSSGVLTDKEFSLVIFGR